MEMSQNASKSELGIFVKDSIPVVSSRDIAARFGKSHKTILRSIDNLECSDEFTRHNFVPCKYKNQKNVAQREYLVTKDGFVFLVMGFTGKAAALFKEQFITAFNNMAESLRNRNDLKMSYWPMMDAIKEAHEDPKFYHYVNENNMIYKILLGMDAKRYKEKMGLKENVDLRDHITNEQQEILLRLQETNTGLIRIGMEFKKRKVLLNNLFLKYQDKLQNNILPMN